MVTSHPVHTQTDRTTNLLISSTVHYVHLGGDNKCCRSADNRVVGSERQDKFLTQSQTTQFVHHANYFVTGNGGTQPLKACSSADATANVSRSEYLLATT